MSSHLWWFRVAGAVGLAFGAAVALSAPVPLPEEKDSRSAEEIRQAKDDLRALQALAGDAKADPEELWRVWQAFRLKHAGTAEWRRALGTMAKAPSPLDRLNGDQILTAARTPGMPEEVVAALGGNRGMHRGPVWLVAVSGDGHTLVSGSYGVHFWDPDSLKERICVDTDGAGGVTLSPEGKTMLTAGRDPKTFQTFIRVWDLTAESPKVRAVLPGRGEQRFWVIALAADRKTLFTIEVEGRLKPYPNCIRVWDIGPEKPKELSPLKIDDDGVKRQGVLYYLACASRSMTLVDIGGANEAPIRVWDLDKNPPQVRCCVAAWNSGNTPGPMAISPDGKMLAIRHIRDQAIVLWDVSGAEAKGVERFDAGHYSDLTFLPSGNVLAWADRDGWLILRPLNAAGRSEVKLEEGQTTAAIPLGFKPRSLAFTDDGKTAVISGEDQVVHIWDLDKGKERFPPSGHRGRIGALAFSPDGKTLASGGAEGMIRIWDLTGVAPKPVASLEGHTSGVVGLDFSPDGKTLASIGPGWGLRVDPTVRLWDLSGREPRQKASWSPHGIGTHSIVYSPKGDLLATAGTDGPEPGGEKFRAAVRLWDVTQNPPAEQVALHFQDKEEQDEFTSISQGADQAAFDATGNTLGFLTGEQTIRLYDVTKSGLTAGPVLRPFARELSVSTWAFSPDGATLATLGTGPPEKLPMDKGILSLWRRDGAAIKAWPDFTPVPWEGYFELLFSPDGRRVAGVDSDGALLVYDVPSGELAYRWKEAGAAKVAFAPDGRHLAVGGTNGVVYILRLTESPMKESP